MSVLGHFPVPKQTRCARRSRYPHCSVDNRRLSSLLGSCMQGMSRLSFQIVGVALILISSGCRNPRTEAHLIGSWKSNKAATMRAIVDSADWSGDEVDKIERLNIVLGEMVNTFDKKTVVSEYKENSREYGYRILGSGDDWVEIELNLGRAPVIKRLQFVDDWTAYWVDTDGGFSERFDKVRP